MPVSQSQVKKRPLKSSEKQQKGRATFQAAGSPEEIGHLYEVPMQPSAFDDVPENIEQQVTPSQHNLVENGPPSKVATVADHGNPTTL